MSTDYPCSVRSVATDYVCVAALPVWRWSLSSVLNPLGRCPAFSTRLVEVVDAARVVLESTLSQHLLLTFRATIRTLLAPQTTLHERSSSKRMLCRSAERMAHAVGSHQVATRNETTARTNKEISNYVESETESEARFHAVVLPEHAQNKNVVTVSPRSPGPEC